MGEGRDNGGIIYYTIQTTLLYTTILTILQYKLYTVLFIFMLLYMMYNKGWWSGVGWNYLLYNTYYTTIQTIHCVIYFYVVVYDV